jgi:ribosome assembly protein 1
VTFTIRGSPLPKAISAFLLQNVQCLRRLLRDGGIEVPSDEEDMILEQEGFDPGCDSIQKPTTDPHQFWTALQNVCREVGGEWKDITDHVMSFGPRMAGGCVLIDNRKGDATLNSCVIVSHLKETNHIE